MATRNAHRVVREHAQTIAASPERVFPLLCPVREAEWLDGWAYEMVHSESGVAEDGCVFRTRSRDLPETTWIVTRHDAGAGIVEFARVTAGLVATVLRLETAPAPGGRTSLRVRYTHTALGPEGAELIDRLYSEEAFAAAMAWWERSMNHFLASGTLLRHGS